MITARYEPLLFPRERSPSPHLSSSRFTPSTPSTPTNSKNDTDDIDRFMELAHAALEEATKEEDAKGVLQELVERVLARTGAPLMAGVIAEQLRSQEVIEQLAEKSYERQRRRQIQKYSTTFKSQKRRNYSSVNNTLSQDEGNHSLSAPPSTTTLISSSSSSSSQRLTVSAPSSSLSSSSSSSSSSISCLSNISSLKDPQDPETLDEAVTRDQFVIQQQLHTDDTKHDSLLLISEYIWRLFRLLILASLVALIYHYVCAYPQQFFI
ncbi:uncharacterized protein BX664DRAFT_333281 [Halteromyces radiatus]|uniref:uncharacterized protein n=1 Tax=Halteromyces radiatus TaxID=101107 RepID=UPI00221FB6D0|nr:uncharacterized protein BX664DRAFT_333281 [Halteromyces radiatus]KAI8089541.1 hypothetical protein BX664DRAFT_333281 [Halteromyces radiatus]